MDELSGLDRLSIAEKDGLIRELWPLRALVRQLSEQVAALTAKVAEHRRLMATVKHFRMHPSIPFLHRNSLWQYRRH